MRTTRTTQRKSGAAVGGEKRRLHGMGATLSASVVWVLVGLIWLAGATSSEPAWATVSVSAAMQADEEKKSGEEKEKDKKEEGDEEEDEAGDDDEQKDDKDAEEEGEDEESGDSDEGEKKEGGEKKDEAEQKEDGEKEDKDAASKKEGDEKSESKAGKLEKKDSGKAKPAEPEGMDMGEFDKMEMSNPLLSEEQLSEMKKILMERMRETKEARKAAPKKGKQGPAKAAPAKPAGAKPQAGKRPASAKPPVTNAAPARRGGASAKPPAPSSKGPSRPRTAGKASPRTGAKKPAAQPSAPSASPKSQPKGTPKKKDEKADPPKPKERRSMNVKPRSKIPPGAPKPMTRRTTASGKKRSPAATRGTRGTQGVRASGDAPAGDRSGIIFPMDLPEGTRPWDLHPSEKPFFFSFDRVSPQDLLGDFSRLAGLSVMGMDKVKGQPIIYESLEYMNYWEAFETLNELFSPNGIQVLMQKQHLRVVSSGDLRQYIQSENTFRSRELFEEASPENPILVKVFFVPPTNVAPTQVAQWINDLPESIRLGSTSPGNMHVSGFARDIRKLFFLVDIVNAQGDVKGRLIRWYPVEKGDVNQIADLVRQFVGSGGKVGAPSIKPRRGKVPTQIEPLEDFSEVEVLAVPAAKMLMVKAKLSKQKEVEEILAQLFQHVPEETRHDPVVIPLRYARADEIVGLLESVMSGEPARSTPGKPKVRTPVRRKGATPQADTIDLGGAAAEVTIIPEPNSNSLIVIADDEGVERVRKLLDIFDVPQITPMFVRVSLEYARVEAVQQVLGVLFPGAKGKRLGKGAASSAQLTLVPDTGANTLFLAGKEDVIKRAREIIEQIDIPTAESVRHMVTLVNQSPSTLASLLEKIEGGGSVKGRKGAPRTEGVKFIPFDETNTLIVICPDTKWPELRELIESVDRDVEDFLVTRTFKIEKGDVKNVASLLREWFGKGSPGRGKPKRKGASSSAATGLTIVVDEAGSQIFVRGDEETVSKMVDFVADIEAGWEETKGTRRTFRLTYISTSDAMKLLTTLYPKSAPKGRAKSGAEGARFATVGQNSIVVEAPPVQMEEIADLISELDTEEQDNTEIRSFPVDGADPQQLVRNLGTMFKPTAGTRKSGKKSGPVFIAAGKKVIAIAMTGEFARIESAIEVLREEPTGMEMRQFKIEYADVGDLSRFLSGLLEAYASELTGGAAGGKAGKGRKVVRVDADPRTSTLFIAAPGSVIAYAEELIPELDFAMPDQLEGLVVRTIVLERAQVSDLIQSLQKMMQGGASSPAKKAAGRTGPRSFHAQMTGKMKGQVSMVPAPGANSVILRGIESDVDQVEELIRVIDDSAMSTKKIAKRYDATDTGMYVEDLADLVTAVTGGGGRPKPKSDDELLDPIGGPRISKDMIITTDYYSDTMVVVATPEKHEEIALLFDALTASLGGLPEPEVGVLTMVEVANADPDYVKEMVEEILDDLIDRGPKTRLTLMPDSNRIALKGPPEQLATVAGWIRELDIAGVAPPPKFEIRSPGKTPVPIEQLLRMIQQRTPGLEFVVHGVELDDDGKSAAEKYGIEEINPTYGPATLAYISVELGCLTAGAVQDPAADEDESGADAVQQEDKDESGEEEDEPALPTSIADMKPTHKALIKITVDPATGALLIEGAPKDIREFNDKLDDVLKDLEMLKIDKPDIRVFKLRYVNVTEAARVLETILGAQMGGAASRQQQAMQQIRQQQQNLQRQQQVRQQAQMRKMMQQMAGGGGKEAAPEAEEEEPSTERDEGPRQFGASKIHVYPDSRTSTIIVRAATEDYPVILELLGKIDQKPAETEFKVFKMARLKAADVEAAIKSILRMDRPAPSMGGGRPGRPGRPAQPGQGQTAQLMAQLQQQINAMQDTGGGEGVAINWAEQVTITSEASTNTILAAGPKQAIVQIESMIEELEGQEIDQETVKTIQLEHASVDDILPALNEVFSAARAPGSGKTRPGGGKAGEAVMTAFSQVLIAGDSRTNTLIVKALDSDMEDVEELIAVLDVETEGGRPELHALGFADASSVASALSEMFVIGDKKKGNIRVVAETGTNSILITAPPNLREQMVAQLKALDERARRGSEPRTIPIVSGSAELIAEQLQPIFGGRSKSGSSVTIVGNNMARKLVVMAPDAVFAEIEKLVGVLDVPTSESTIHIYELEYAAAEVTLAKMQDIITQMIRNKIATGAGKDVDLDAFAATADPRTNSLIVLGSPATHLMIGTVLGQLDVPEKGASQMDTMMFPLRIAQANEVARQIQDLFKDRKGPGISPPVATPNPSLNVLFVRGTQSQLEEVRGFIENLENITELGQDELQSYTIRLIYADPEQTAEMLDKHFRKKFDDMKQAGVKGVKPTDMRVSITPDPNTSQIFVTASAANKEVLDGLLASIDVPEAEDAATPNTRVFTVEHGDPNTIANSLNKVFQPSGKRGSPKDRVLAVPDPISGTVVVVANEENMERAAKLIAEMNTETSARQMFTYKVVEARAGELVQVLREHINQSKGGGGRRGKTPVSLVADEPTNTILVNATPQEYEQLLPTIELLDQPPTAETGMMVRQIEVTHVEAREVAQALTHMFVQGRPQKRGQTPIGVTNPVGTRTILVRSDERTFEQIQRVVADMDRPEAGSNDMRVFTLTNLEPAETKTMLEDYFKKPGVRGNELVGGVRVTESDSLNAVVVSGPTEQLEQAAAFIKEVDLDPAERGDVPQIIHLEWADAGQIAETLDRMFGQSGGRGGRGGRGQQAGKAPVIIPEVASNSLIVRARPKEMSQIRSMVLVLDTEALKGSGGNVEIIQVAQGLNIDELASQIESVVNAGERARAKAVPGAKAAEIAIGTHQHTNSLLISGAPQLFGQVRTIVETLQRSGGPGPNKVVIRKAVHRSPAEIKLILDELITGKKSGGGRSSPRRPTPPRRPTRGRR